MTLLRRFLHDDTGAITIDWVALAAGILLLGIATVYALFNSGVKSVVAEINAALGAVGLIDIGAAPEFNGIAVAADPIEEPVVNNDLVLRDGTTVPEGSKVVDSKTTTIDGATMNVVVLETPGDGKIAIVSDTSTGRPPTDSLVTSGTTITTTSGATYDMSGYSGAPSSYKL